VVGNSILPAPRVRAGRSRRHPSRLAETRHQDKRDRDEHGEPDPQRTEAGGLSTIPPVRPAAADVKLINRSVKPRAPARSLGAVMSLITAVAPRNVADHPSPIATSPTPMTIAFASEAASNAPTMLVAQPAISAARRPARSIHRPMKGANANIPAM
jgi:hypothetical protein